MNRMVIILVMLLILIPIDNNAIDSIVEEKSDVHHGKTLYVGGDGPNNYTKIQDAIDNASDGDTIVVYPKIYKENLLLQKQLALIGIDYPVIDAHGKDGITIMAENCIVDEFKIMNGSNGTVILSDDNIISNNIIENNNHSDVRSAGVYILNSVRNRIINNTISYNKNGIILHNSSQNIISYNNISGHIYWHGIWIINSIGNNISSNSFFNNDFHILGSSSHKNSIYQNFFISLNGSVLSLHGNINIIYNNTFKYLTGIWISGINDEFIYNNASESRIFLKGENATIKNNILRSIYIEGGNLSQFLHEISNNTCEGKEIYYIKNMHNIIIPKNVSQVIIVNCSNIIIENLSFINTAGIEIIYSSNVTVANNVIAKNGEGIYMLHSNNVVITHNKIVENSEGIRIIFSKGIKIVNNNISSNFRAFFWWGAFFCLVKNNNLIDNRYEHEIGNSFFNFWLHNYWDEWYLPVPKPILVCIVIPKLFMICPCFPWLNFDWLPALKPIEV
ncbi:MAG TPA: hypothetical protein ENI53_02545 [Thermoplasmatales archaeon]|nr:hypothetical protein [Thermoplasmatales archaeon]